MMDALAERNAGEARPKGKIQDGLFLFSFLIIGADLWSVSLGGMTLRLVNLTLLICFLAWLFKGAYRMSLKGLAILLPFLIAMTISGIGSVSLTGTVSYLLWSTYNIVITFFVSFTWAFWNDQEYILERTRRILYAMAALLLAQYALGLAHLEIPGLRTDFYKFIPRPSLWFYEPSYLATYLVTYFALFMALTLESTGLDAKRAKSTLFVLFITMVFTTSTTGFLGIAISTVLVVAMANIRPARKAGFFIAAAAVAGLIILGVYLAFPKIVTIFIGRLFTSSLKSASGGRIDAWAESLGLFLQRPIFGFGAGAYAAVTGGDATNVTLELLATVGVVGCIAFFAIPAFILRFRGVSPIVKAFSLGTLAFLITLQANQNYMRLYYWMHLGITFGMVMREKAEKKTTRTIPGDAPA